VLAEGEKLSSSPLRAYLMSYEPHKVRWMFPGELRQPRSIRFDGATAGACVRPARPHALAPAALPAATQPAASADVAESAPDRSAQAPKPKLRHLFPTGGSTSHPRCVKSARRDLCGGGVHRHRLRPGPGRRRQGPGARSPTKSKLAALFDEAEEDLLAYMSFPKGASGRNSLHRSLGTPQWREQAPHRGDPSQ
jgi:hypothetical protein